MTRRHLSLFYGLNFRQWLAWDCGQINSANREKSLPKPVIYIAALLLFVGAAPLPYGYYSLLRIVATIVFVLAALVSLNREYKVLPWIFAVLAILFNPILKIYLPKEMWIFIDIACGIFLVSVAPSISLADPANENEQNNLS